MAAPEPFAGSLLDELLRLRSVHAEFEQLRHGGMGGAPLGHSVPDKGGCVIEARELLRAFAKQGCGASHFDPMRRRRNDKALNAPNQLPPKALHLAISDRIEGVFANALTRFRFAPGLAVSLCDGERNGVVSMAGRAIAEWTSSHPGILLPIMQAQSFNIREPTQEIQFQFGGREVRTIWRALG